MFLVDTCLVVYNIYDKFLSYREAALKAASSAPLFSGKGKYVPREKYPNVYDSMEEARQTSAFVGGVKVGKTEVLRHLATAFTMLLVKPSYCLINNTLYFGLLFSPLHYLCCLY